MILENFIDVSRVNGIPEAELEHLQDCADELTFRFAKNSEKRKYYEGKIKLSEVNLGLALPHGLRGLEIGCSWGAKTVDVLASRSMFDGFVAEDGTAFEELNAIVEGNQLLSAYSKLSRDELLYGSAFATLCADKNVGCKIRFHSPLTASALWDGEKGRVSCGLAIIDSAPVNNDVNWVPTVVNFYTDDAIYVMHRHDNNVWLAERNPHKMGRPLIEPLVWNASSDKPFGRSRLKEPIRRLIQGYVRTIANATIGLEFATAPQKYILGITDEQYDAVVNQKFRQYVGNILAATSNPETGEKPTFGQLQQGNISPHVEMLRILATQFSAATGLTVTDTGVVNDANPTSSDAILAQSQTLVALAEQLNAGNANSLKTIALMAMAIVNNTTMDGLSDEQRNIVAHFKNPAMPSVAVTADAAVKIASARPEFAQTDVFLEMMGYDQADIRRIKAQEQRERGQVALMELESTQRE